MVTTLLGVASLMAGVLAGVTVIGVAVLAWCPGRARPPSAAPALGIAVSVLWLSTIGLLVAPGSWVAVASLAMAALVLLATALLRRRGELCAQIRAWSDLAGSVLVGFACAAPFLAVIAGARTTRFVHLTGNHDGFFFAAIPEWLLGHDLVGSPGMTAAGTPTGTPLIGSTWDILQHGSWRIGSDAFTAAVSRVTGIGPLDLWFPITLVYLVVFATAAHALA